MPAPIIVCEFASKQANTGHQLPSPSGTGQASAPISCLATLRRPVFLVNSRLGLVTAGVAILCCFFLSCALLVEKNKDKTQATENGTPPLLPRLRGQFAEFLRESCLAPLGMLYLPTCVGFGYRSSLACRSWSFSRRGRSSLDLGVSFHLYEMTRPGMCSTNAVDTSHGQPADPPRPSLPTSDKYRNVNLFTIGDASRPGLRT